MHEPTEFKVLYSFAGPSRPSGIPETLEKLANSADRPVKVTVDAFDVLRDAKHDLLDEGLQKLLLDRIAKGYYDAVLMSPPCGTWSRAPWANNHGPRPLHPFGFPWLESWRRTKVDRSNSMIELCLQCITLCLKHGLLFLIEHPEDLGATSRYGPNARPASIWQLLPIKEWVKHSQALSGALFQCRFGAGSQKPTRLLHNLAAWLWSGMPRLDALGLDALGRYMGPLPRLCHSGRRHIGLIRRNPDNSFATTAAAAYPPQMDFWLASTLFQALQKRGKRGPIEGEKAHPGRLEGQPPEQPQGHPHGKPPEHPHGKPPEQPQGHPHGKPQGQLHGVSQGHPHGVPQGHPHGEPRGHPQEVQEQQNSGPDLSEDKPPSRKRAAEAVEVGAGKRRRALPQPAGARASHRGLVQGQGSPGRGRLGPQLPGCSSVGASWGATLRRCGQASGGFLAGGGGLHKWHGQASQT